MLTPKQSDLVVGITGALIGVAIFIGLAVVAKYSPPAISIVAVSK